MGIHRTLWDNAAEMAGEVFGFVRKGYRNTACTGGYWARYGANCRKAVL
jgi:hypothetical protein